MPLAPEYTDKLIDSNCFADREEHRGRLWRPRSRLAQIPAAIFVDKDRPGRHLDIRPAPVFRLAPGARSTRAGPSGWGAVRLLERAGRRATTSADPPALASVARATAGCSVSDTSGGGCCGRTRGPLLPTCRAHSRIERVPARRCSRKSLERGLARGGGRPRRNERIDLRSNAAPVDLPTADERFLRHGRRARRRPVRRPAQPVLLTTRARTTIPNPARPCASCLGDGGWIMRRPMPARLYDAHRAHLFDGEDRTRSRKGGLRERWRRGPRPRAFEATYWRPDEQGRWQRQGSVIPICRANKKRPPGLTPTGQ